MYYAKDIFFNQKVLIIMNLWLNRSNRSIHTDSFQVKFLVWGVGHITEQITVSFIHVAMFSWILANSVNYRFPNKHWPSCDSHYELRLMFCASAVFVLSSTLCTYESRHKHEVPEVHFAVLLCRDASTNCCYLYSRIFNLHFDIRQNLLLPNFGRFKYLMGS